MEHVRPGHDCVMQESEVATMATGAGGVRLDIRSAMELALLFADLARRA